MNPTDLNPLFDVVPLPNGGIPVVLAVAFPNSFLAARPGFPKSALPQYGRVAGGRGLSQEHCRLSALGEAAELCSCSAWGDDQLVKASAAELGPTAIAPDQLNGFSTAQHRSRTDWNVRYGGFDWRPPPHNPATPIDWLEVEDGFGGNTAYVPADFAFIGRKEPGDDSAAAIGDSNGCACGTDDDTARIAAVLELCERDATARWWYGFRRRPLLNPASLGDATGLVAWLCGRERRFALFDITSDIAVPVVAAVSAETEGSDVVMGFAASGSQRQAALSALTEMVQMEFSLETARAFGGDAGHWAEWRSRVTLATPPLDVFASRESTTIRDDDCRYTLGNLLEVCSRARIPLWFANMTRDVIGVPAWRAISPALCHTKPRFALPRLLAPDPQDFAGATASPETQVPLLI